MIFNKKDGISFIIFTFIVPAVFSVIAHFYPRFLYRGDTRDMVPWEELWDDKWVGMLMGAFCWFWYWVKESSDNDDKNKKRDFQ